VARDERAMTSGIGVDILEVELVGRSGLNGFALFYSCGGILVIGNSGDFYV